MSVNFRIAATLAAFSTASMAMPAVAAVLPPIESAEYSYSVDGNGYNVFQNRTAYTGPISVAQDYWSLGVRGEPQALIEYVDTATQDPDEREDGMSVFSSLVYHFRFSAANQAAFDAALAHGSLKFDGFTELDESTGVDQISGIASVILFSQYSFDGPRAIEFHYQAECNQFNLGDCGRQDFSATRALTLFADPATLSFTGAVSLFGEFHSPRVGAVGAVRTMRIDPVLSLTGNGLSMSDYRLELSPGIGNGVVGAVPEPASWAMMIAGFTLAGASMRRRQVRNLGMVTG